jgi:hypothetical protein
VRRSVAIEIVDVCTKPYTALLIQARTWPCPPPPPHDHLRAH